MPDLSRHKAPFLALAWFVATILTSVNFGWIRENLGVSITIPQPDCEAHADAFTDDLTDITIKVCPEFQTEEKLKNKLSIIRSKLSDPYKKHFEGFHLHLADTVKLQSAEYNKNLPFVCIGALFVASILFFLWFRCCDQVSDRESELQKRDVTITGLRSDLSDKQGKLNLLQAVLRAHDWSPATIALGVTPSKDKFEEALAAAMRIANRKSD